MVYRLNNRNNYPVLNEGIGENLYPTLGEIHFCYHHFFSFLRRKFYNVVVVFFFPLRNFYEFILPHKREDILFR